MTAGNFAKLFACLFLMALPPLDAGTDDPPAIVNATVDYAANQVTLTGCQLQSGRCGAYGGI